MFTVKQDLKKEVLEFIAGRTPENIIIQGKDLQGMDFRHDLNYFEGETIEEKVMDLLTVHSVSLPQECSILIYEDGEYADLEYVLTPTILEEVEEYLEQTKDILHKLEDIKFSLQMGKELDGTQKAFLDLYVKNVK